MRFSHTRPEIGREKSQVVTAPSATVLHYDRDAARFGALYSQPRFEDVHLDLLPFLPKAGGAILDVGAGNGRDAVALVQRGYVVTAVEPSLALQAWAKQHYGQTAIAWINDTLPSLAALRSDGRRFDFILCSAVLMHVPPGEIRESTETLAELLGPTGHLAISVRDRQAEDPAGVFHDVEDEVLIDAGKQQGLRLLRRGGSEDQLGRSDVRWRSLLFGSVVST